MTKTIKTAIFTKLNSYIFYILFLSLLAVIAYVSREHVAVIDWTAAQRNTLSETSQQILAQIKEPIKFTAYVPDDPRLHDRVKQRLKKYMRAKKDVSLDFVNPELQIKQAKAEGIEHQGQVSIRVGERHAVIPSLTEASIATVLQRLSRANDQHVVFLEGHKERSPLDDKSSGMSQLATVLKSRGFSFQPHHLLRTQDIPEKTQLLVIASPQKDYTEGEVAIISRYLKQGGNLLWLHEPGGLQGLNQLEAQLGLLIDEGTLVDANVALREVLGIKHPAVIPVIDYNNSAISGKLDMHTLFPLATSIERDDSSNEGWRYEAFLQSGLTSWLELDELTGDVSFDSESGDKAGPLTIGMSMQRQFNPTEEGLEPKMQRIVVVGDSDFMLNAFVGHVANMDLSLSIFNWLVGDDQLIAIKATTARDTRLNLSPTILYIMGLTFLIGLPLGLMLIGGIIWRIRRRR